VLRHGPVRWHLWATNNGLISLNGRRINLVCIQVGVGKPMMRQLHPHKIGDRRAIKLPGEAVVPMLPALNAQRSGLRRLPRCHLGTALTATTPARVRTAQLVLAQLALPLLPIELAHAAEAAAVEVVHRGPRLASCREVRFLTAIQVVKRCGFLRGAGLSN